MTFNESIKESIAGLEAAIDARLAELASAKERIARLEAAMKHVVNELEEDFDTVDGGDGQPAPNKAICIAHELLEALYGPGGW